MAVPDSANPKKLDLSQINASAIFLFQFSCSFIDKAVSRGRKHKFVSFNPITAINESINLSQYWLSFPSLPYSLPQNHPKRDNSGPFGSFKQWIFGLPVFPDS